MVLSLRNNLVLLVRSGFWSVIYRSSCWVGILELVSVCREHLWNTPETIAFAVGLQFVLVLVTCLLGRLKKHSTKSLYPQKYITLHFNISAVLFS